jgi:hypothetical protein
MSNALAYMVTIPPGIRGGTKFAVLVSSLHSPYV